MCRVVETSYERKKAKVDRGRDFLVNILGGTNVKTQVKFNNMWVCANLHYARENTLIGGAQGQSHLCVLTCALLARASSTWIFNEETTRSTA